ncbi:MAG: hypothetical protein QM784_11855 [Polyangiaceae bacterium]
MDIAPAASVSCSTAMASPDVGAATVLTCPVDPPFAVGVPPTDMPLLPPVLSPPDLTPPLPSERVAEIVAKVSPPLLGTYAVAPAL